MKKNLFIGMIILLIIINCTQEKKSPVEGSWKLLSGKYATPDSVMNYPLSNNAHYMKIIGKKYFSTTWQDTTFNKSSFYYAGFNGGTYTFENGIYTETEMCFSSPSNIGIKVAFKAEINNDTLVLTNIPEKEAAGYSFIEKWKRLE